MRRLGRFDRATPEQILPFSTGVIMEMLPADRVVARLPAAVADAKAGQLGRSSAGDHDHRHRAQVGFDSDPHRRTNGHCHRHQQGRPA
jgi:hypothetical protein